MEIHRSTLAWLLVKCHFNSLKIVLGEALGRIACSLEVWRWWSMETRQRKLISCAWQSLVGWWYCCSCRWGKTTSLHCSHQRACCSSPKWYTGVESNGGMILTGENRRHRGITCPSAILSTTNPIRIDQGAKPGLREERSATKCLSHDTAFGCYQSVVTQSLSLSLRQHIGWVVPSPENGSSSVNVREIIPRCSDSHRTTDCWQTAEHKWKLCVSRLRTLPFWFLTRRSLEYRHVEHFQYPVRLQLHVDAEVNVLYVNTCTHSSRLSTQRDVATARLVSQGRLDY
jgi:hypothetical protein